RSIGGCGLTLLALHVPEQSVQGPQVDIQIAGELKEQFVDLFVLSPSRRPARKGRPEAEPFQCLLREIVPDAVLVGIGDEQDGSDDSLTHAGYGVNDLFEALTDGPSLIEKHVE